MLSGDPVGEPIGVETLLPVVVAFAGEHGLRLAALGVSAEGRALFEQAGLRALYLGDEAIVDGCLVQPRRPPDPEGAAVRDAAAQGWLPDGDRGARLPRA